VSPAGYFFVVFLSQSGDELKQESGGGGRLKSEERDVIMTSPLKVKLSHSEGGRGGREGLTGGRSVEITNWLLADSAERPSGFTTAAF